MEDNIPTADRQSASMVSHSIFDSNEPADGARATESAHRKVELQSPDDLQYIFANIQRAGREKLDTHFPPDAAPEGDDVMRQKRKEHVEQVGHTHRICEHKRHVDKTAVHSRLVRRGQG